MGGGDLNLKKSWHPHTMKNQEKVWKAEQSKNQEERKLSDLRKEIEDEKNREELKRIGVASGVLAKGDGDKKLEWMYKSSTELINRDEYLLGRTIDKSFEVLQAEEQRSEQQNFLGVKQPINHVEHECIPFSIRAFRGTESTEQVDLQRKVLEDPLMLIKQREMESRRKLLENPVKLKELHRILKTDQVLAKTSSRKGKRRENKSKKSKKSKRKHKKRARSSSSSSTYSSAASEKSDKDLDREVAKRYKKLKSSLNAGQQLSADISLSKLLDAKYETISKELDKASKTRSKASRCSHSGDYRQNSRNRCRSGDRRRHSRSRSHKRHDKDKAKQNCSRGSSPETRGRHDRGHAEERQQCESRIPRSRAPTDWRKEKPVVKRSTAAPQKMPITDEEKETRRREMMENAAWRENDRSTAVQKHRDAYAREEEQSRGRDFDKEFLNKEVKKAFANQTSVGSRIRSNLNNIQRTSAAMDSNFARK